MSTNIALARKQTVFAVLEAGSGTLQMPAYGGSGVTLGFIRPAGQAIINQSPSFSDSAELRNTLDVQDQFQDAMPPGSFTIPMYCRPSGTIGNKPQGAALFKALQGSCITGTTASLASGISNAATLLTYKAASDWDGIPTVGVVSIGSEKMYFTKIWRQNEATEGTLGNMTRGYAGTSATLHSVNDVITLSSVFYKQETSCPSCSIWVKTDHFLQALSGATPQSCVVGVTNEGGVMLTFTGQGMQMYWAGTDEVVTQCDSGGSGVVVNDADRFSAGIYVYNSTKNDNNSNGGFKIDSVNSTTNKLVFTSATGATWEVGDTVEGYLPSATVIGSVVEGKDTDVELDNVAATFKNTDLTIGSPKQYITDEVGTEYPEEYVEDMRAIESTLNLYFKKADAKYFAEGYSGNNVKLGLFFGDTYGYKMDICMPKFQLVVPNINFTTPTVELSMPGKALGTNGEDSCEIVFH